MSTTIIFNGKIIPSHRPCIQHNDRGFTLGHGLFETIFINKDKIPLLDYHWARLEKSAPLLGLILPFSRQALVKMLFILIKENDLSGKTAGARVTVTYGEAARGISLVTPPKPTYTISVFEHTYAPKTDFSVLIAATRKNAQSIATQIKSTSYLDNILAKKEALSAGYDEAILLNTSSNIADGAVTNVFIVQKSHIYTPPVADGALPGVVRQVFLTELMAEFSLVEKSISPAELLAADEVFVTNALMGVQPVSQINDKRYDHFSVGNAAAIKFKTIKNYI